jgi:hypothetical protein
MAISHAGVNVIVLWAVFGCFLCIVAVGLRFYARKLKGLSYSINDYAALGGMVSFSMLCSPGNAALTFGRSSALRWEQLSLKVRFGVPVLYL